MEENLKEALEYMFYFAGIAPPKSVSYYKKENWFTKHTWTERQQEKYTEWLTKYLTKNWKGIMDRKPSSKIVREKAARQFVFNYGLKTRPVNIKDFTPLISDGQLKEVLSERELQVLNKWLFGQTRSPHGIYKWDLERWLNTQK